MLNKDNIKSQVDIVSYIGQYTKLASKGNKYWGCCPFHGEKTPSFEVDPGKNGGVYHCFGCNAQGDIFTFVQEYEGVDFKQALEILSKDNIPVLRDPLPQKEKKPAWEPILPVPSGVIEDLPKTFPMFLKGDWQHFEISEYYPYYSRAGKLLCYYLRVPRVNKDGKKIKEVIPATYCKSLEGKKKWRFQALPPERPLYGLYEMTKKPNATIILVEGEKCVNAGNKLFKDRDEAVFMSWPGGSKGIKKSMWDLIKDKKVILWPDSDSSRYPDEHKNAGQLLPYLEQPGNCAMVTIYKYIKGTNEVKYLKVPEIYQNGWDCADAIQIDKWDEKKVFDFIKTNLINVDDLYKKKPHINNEDIADDIPFQHLGYNSSNGSICYYFLPFGTGKVHCLTAASMSKMNLLSVAPLHYWEREYPTKSGANFTSAANDLMRASEMTGVYNPLRCRGRGAWFDQGRSVLHIGNKLIVDGEVTDLDKIDSFYIYEAEIITERGKSFMTEILPTDESKKLLEITKLISWENNINSRYLAGWLFLAPICGAIDWRPHVWVTGESGSGKTWIYENIIAVILKDIVLNATSVSSAAGLRQTLGNDAFPVIFDEIEAEDSTAQKRVQSIIELARVASSNKNASIFKGTVSGQAIAYIMRSMFLFSSINVKILQQADERRISILKLVKRPDWDNNNEFEILKGLVFNNISSAYCTKLRARAVARIPIIRENIKIFASVIGKKLRSVALGDQLGTLLAGAHCLESDGVITPAEVEEFIKDVNWEEKEDFETVTDQDKCMQAILQQLVKVDRGGGSEAIGALIRVAIRERKHSYEDLADIEKAKKRAKEVLCKHGITTIKTKDIPGYYIAFSKDNRQLHALLKETPWEHGYKHILCRFKGAKDKTAYFADGKRVRAITIHQNIIFGEDDFKYEDEETYF